MNRGVGEEDERSRSAFLLFCVVGVLGCWVVVEAVV